VFGGVARYGDEALARRRGDGQLAGVLLLTGRALYVVGDGRWAIGEL
jgi:hypothetical protein